MPTRRYLALCTVRSCLRRVNCLKLSELFSLHVQRTQRRIDKSGAVLVVLCKIDCSVQTSIGAFTPYHCEHRRSVQGRIPDITRGGFRCVAAIDVNALPRLPGSCQSHRAPLRARAARRGPPRGSDAPAGTGAGGVPSGGERGRPGPTRGPRRRTPRDPRCRVFAARSPEKLETCHGDGWPGEQGFQNFTCLPWPNICLVHLI
jgi:hypothetical protein